jgi:diketogulonate reductase-like aldo/keto reductase
VLIRYSIDKGYSVIPKSTTPSRIEENFNVFGFKLDDEEVKKLDGLERGFRSCDLAKFWKWPLYE